MKKIISLLKMTACAAITAGVLSSTCIAAFSTNDAGTSTAQFLKLGAGAREVAMGEAAAGIADDSTAIYWNPAGLNNVSEKTLSVMHAIWFESISYDWASYAQRFGNLGVFGIAAQYMSYGSLTETDTAGAETGSFTPTDLCVALSYAKGIKGYNVGVNLKYISSTIQKTATAYALDAGVQRGMMDNKLVLGLAAQNVGTQMKFISESDPLPMNIKLGGAYWFNKNWAVALDANAPIDNQVFVCAGTEYTFNLGENMNAAGRLGYNTQAKDTGGLNGASAGLGFTYMKYSIDYAFVPYGDLGNTQRISFSMKF